MLARRSRPSAGLQGPPYPRLDLDGVWAWAQEALAELAAMAHVCCVVPVAHGAAGVLMEGDRPALPALDYEHDGPDAVAGELAELLDPFALTASPVLPLGLNVGAQLLWQQRAFPDAFARASDLLMLPQYWAWRLSGVKAVEVTALGAHTHLWRPGERRLSGLVERRGWTRLFPHCGGPGSLWGRSPPSSPRRPGCGATVTCSPASTTAMPPGCRTCWRARGPLPCSRPGPG